MAPPYLRRFCAVLLLLPAIAVAERPERAKDPSGPSTTACLGANEQAQKLRAQHKLSDSREQLKICSQTSCPTAVQRDCVQWLHEVEAALPTLSFSAKNRNGEDLTAVSVWIDGAQLIDHLDGSSIAVDPGHHTFRFDHDGDPSINRDILVNEGDKARTIEVRFGTEAPATQGHTGGAVPVAPLVVGGIGAAALIGGLVLFAERRGAIPEVCKDPATVKVMVDGEEKSASQCRQGATQQDADAAKSAADASYIGLGVALGGGALLATGIVWFLVEKAGSSSKPAESARRGLHVSPTFGLGYAGVGGSF